MFKVGDKVVCVNINNIDDNANFLVKYNIYIITTIINNLVGVKNIKIKNRIRIYSHNRFISLTKFRKIKIKKICSRLETK